MEPSSLYVTIISEGIGQSKSKNIFTLLVEQL